ncbi:I78 family peptidase inhibitor [Porphyrobacter sp. GA68]|uniref:I78 family peptidase inhibitor n=1 Tax=Porphyrobacter sp. GA68 TaxID=2883480 RepID=UPI0035936EB2
MFLGGCLAPQSSDLRERAAAAGHCDDRSAQTLLGRTANAALGAEVLRLSRARHLEWIAPDMIATTAFNPWRIRVSYDDTMAILAIRCG